jgi:ABC-type dipeptide/oligopeptide/nickel transport system permease component
MLNYILRRLLLMIPTLIGITLLVFFVMALSPGGLGASLRNAEGNMRPEQRKIIEDYYKERYGLDQPLWKQYLRWANKVSPIGIKDAGTGYPSAWRAGFKTPDLGESFIRHRPVIDVIADALPITLLLNLITVPFIYAVAILTGIYAAKHRGKMLDVGTGTTFLALWSLPSMWVGVMLLGFFANKDIWQWFPTAGLHDTQADAMSFLPSGGQMGWLVDLGWHLVLPVICLTYGGFAFLSKLMRASVLENLSADYARTARAKGLSERVVLMRHVLSNSLLPLITVAAGVLPGLLGGSVVVETIFSINGMGRLIIEAINMKDRELVMSETFVISIISLLCILVSDILYAVADPRVSYE